MKWLAGIVPACLVSAAVAQDIALPDGASLVHDATDAAQRFQLPIGVVQDGLVPTRSFEGDVRNRVWRVVPSIGVARLLASLRPQLTEAGYDLILTCETWECGGYAFRLALPDIGPPVMIVDLGRFGFIATENPDTGAALAVIVSTTRDASYVQVTTLIPAAIAAPLAESGAQELQTVQPAGTETGGAFEAQLLKAGGIVLEDLRFETGSATLAAGPFASLSALADFLQANPTRRILLVGHSDAEGSIAGNMALSKRRAEAVRAQLLAEFEVAGDRVRAEGVGFLAPRASNETEAGRLANRRVEAVLMQP